MLRIYDAHVSTLLYSDDVLFANTDTQSLDLPPKFDQVKC